MLKIAPKQCKCIVFFTLFWNIKRLLYTDHSRIPTRPEVRIYTDLLYNPNTLLGWLYLTNCLCSDDVHVLVIIFVNDNIGLDALSQEIKKHPDSTYAPYSVTVIGKLQVE